MKKFRKVDSKIWEISELDPIERYLYLYFLTNPHINSAGCYEISLRQVANETGLNRETVYTTINKLYLIHKLIIYSETSKEILLLKWIKDYWNDSLKLAKCVFSDISKIKCKTFKNYMLSQSYKLHQKYKKRQ